MKLSIIIPLYNNENTLGRCLESVLSQDIDDCEIIIVDDGSTDDTAELVKGWQNNDNGFGICSHYMKCNNSIYNSMSQLNGGSIIYSFFKIY